MRKNEDLADSLQGSINKLKAAFVGLVDSDETRSFLKMVLTGVTSMVDGFKTTISLISDNATILAAIGVAIGVTIVKAVWNFVAGLRDSVRSVKEVSAALTQIIGQQRVIESGSRRIAAAGGPAGGMLGVGGRGGGRRPSGTSGGISDIRGGMPIMYGGNIGGRGPGAGMAGPVTPSKAQRLAQVFPIKGGDPRQVPLTYPSLAQVQHHAATKRLREMGGPGRATAFGRGGMAQIGGAQTGAVGAATRRALGGGGALSPSVAAAIASRPGMAGVPIGASRGQIQSQIARRGFGRARAARAPIEPGLIPRILPGQREATVLGARQPTTLARGQLVPPMAPPLAPLPIRQPPIAQRTATAISARAPTMLGARQPTRMAGILPPPAPPLAPLPIRQPPIMGVLPGQRAPTTIPGRGPSRAGFRMPTQLAGPLGHVPIPGILGARGITQAQGKLAFGAGQIPGYRGGGVVPPGAIAAAGPGPLSSRLGPGRGAFRETGMGIGDKASALRAVRAEQKFDVGPFGTTTARPARGHLLPPPVAPQRAPRANLFRGGFAETGLGARQRQRSILGGAGAGIKRQTMGRFTGVGKGMGRMGPGMGSWSSRRNCI